MASEILEILEDAASLAGFDLRSLDRFLEHGFATVEKIATDKAIGAAADKLDSDLAEDNNKGFGKGIRPRTWGQRMLAKLGPEELRAGCMLFHLHAHAMYDAAWNEDGLAIYFAMRQNVEALIIHRGGQGYPIAFDNAEHGLLLASAMAIQISARKPEGWIPSELSERNHWASLEGPGAEPTLRALCRQLADGQVWIHSTGLFAPDARAPAAASPLRPEGLEQRVEHMPPVWRYHLRSLVVQALTRGWITAEQAERITGTHPLHEPWWLLSTTTERMQEMPPALRDFALRLRARFPAALKDLPGNAEPHKAIDIHFDRRPSEESYSWEPGDYAELYGAVGVVAAARWAEQHANRMGKREYEPDPGCHLVRRLAFIRGLDTSESGDEAVAALKGVPAKGLSLVLPWANQAQPLVLRALGLEAAEPARAWLLRYVGGDPAFTGRWGAVFENNPDPQRDVVDVASLRAALEGVSPKARKALCAPYAKVGFLYGAENLLAAVMGDADRAELVESIETKQHQPAVKLLGLLPTKGDADVRERYLLLQKVAKDATRHGAQRQATQRAAAEVGLAHLAQVAGYADAAELEWAMEASQAEALRESFMPRAIDGHEAWIAIEGLKPQLKVRNAAGKVLASVPSALKKHPEMKALTETFAEVKEQLRRFTRLMESRMTLEAPVSRAQLVAGLAHPVMAPVVESIVWIDAAGQVGFFGESGLTGPDGTRAPSGDLLRVAHSVHLLAGPQGAATLSRWQRWLVDSRRVQPFKQVFREIYVPTPAELEAGEESSRYAGRKFGTRVAQGILQSRGWVAAPQDASTQRLLLRNGVTANCGFGVGHFFTEEEDGETATMWFERGGERILLKDVPAIAFSEAMRDIDLLVSRAILEEDSEGTQASSATIEARTDLLRALSPALGAGALEFQERHVLVKGKLASYRIHLASGHIHVEPGAYLCIIPDPVAANRHEPVQLPFAEDDRKTAEIVSKVFLLAHDDRIKDESILSQIRRNA